MDPLKVTCQSTQYSSQSARNERLPPIQSTVHMIAFYVFASFATHVFVPCIIRASNNNENSDLPMLTYFGPWGLSNQYITNMSESPSFTYYLSLTTMYRAMNIVHELFHDKSTNPKKIVLDLKKSCKTAWDILTQMVGSNEEKQNLIIKTVKAIISTGKPISCRDSKNDSQHADYIHPEPEELSSINVQRPPESLADTDSDSLSLQAIHHVLLGPWNVVNYIISHMTRQNITVSEWIKQANQLFVMAQVCNTIIYPPLNGESIGFLKVINCFIWASILTAEKFPQESTHQPNGYYKDLRALNMLLKDINNQREQDPVVLTADQSEQLYKHLKNIEGKIQKGNQNVLPVDQKSAPSIVTGILDNYFLFSEPLTEAIPSQAEPEGEAPESPTRNDSITIPRKSFESLQSLITANYDTLIGMFGKAWDSFSENVQGTWESGNLQKALLTAVPISNNLLQQLSEVKTMNSAKNFLAHACSTVAENVYKTNISGPPLLTGAVNTLAQALVSNVSHQTASFLSTSNTQSPHTNSAQMEKQYFSVDPSEEFLPGIRKLLENTQLTSAQAIDEIHKDPNILLQKTTFKHNIAVSIAWATYNNIVEGDPLITSDEFFEQFKGFHNEKLKIAICNFFKNPPDTLTHSFIATPIAYISTKLTEELSNRLEKGLQQFQTLCFNKNLQSFEPVALLAKILDIDIIDDGRQTPKIKDVLTIGFEQIWDSLDFKHAFPNHFKAEADQLSFKKSLPQCGKKLFKICEYVFFYLVIKLFQLADTVGKIKTRIIARILTPLESTISATINSEETQNMLLQIITESINQFSSQLYQQHPKTSSDSTKGVESKDIKDKKLQTTKRLITNLMPNTSDQKMAPFLGAIKEGVAQLATDQYTETLSSTSKHKDWTASMYEYLSNQEILSSIISPKSLSAGSEERNSPSKEEIIGDLKQAISTLIKKQTEAMIPSFPNLTQRFLDWSVSRFDRMLKTPDGHGYSALRIELKDLQSFAIEFKEQKKLSIEEQNIKDSVIAYINSISQENSQELIIWKHFFIKASLEDKTTYLKEVKKIWHEISPETTPYIFSLTTDAAKQIKTIKEKSQALKISPHEAMRAIVEKNLVPTLTHVQGKVGVDLQEMICQHLIKSIGTLTGTPALDKISTYVSGKIQGNNPSLEWDFSELHALINSMKKKVLKKPVIK